MGIRGSRFVGVSIAALVACGLFASPAMARARKPAPPPAPAVNPNADEWALINLTATDVASANGGSGVKVALMDGLTDCRDTDLAGRCTNTKIAGGRYLFYDNHGTHTAGIIAGAKYGVATSATILNYAVFDDRGYVAGGSKLADAWRSAAAQGATISSMSFGCSKIPTCLSAGEFETMADPNLTLLYVKAAGNDGIALGNESIAISGSTASAAMARFIMVGSVGVTGTISSFSNRPGAGCLMPSGATSCSSDLAWQNHFIVAPGENIYSTLPNNSYGNMSGTSMATPVVAGVAALLEQRWPTLKSNPETVAQILFSTATDEGAPGVDPVYGWGLLNAAKAFQAQGTVTMQSSGGTTTTLTGKTVTSSPTLNKLGVVLGGITVYDMYGRDYTLAETGALRVRPDVLAMRQMLGRRLLGQGSLQDWAEQFFAEKPQPSAFAYFGSAAEAPGSTLALDRSTRMGVDLPFKFGVAQLRLTGGGDARMDFAYDASMRPLSFFASTGLLKNALVANALIRLPGRSRLMVYGIGTTGAMTPHQGQTPLDLRVTDEGYGPGLALSRDPLELRQSGVGVGYWTQPDARTVLGVNLSVLTQTGGYYTLTSDLAAFDKPTHLFNLGVAGIRRIAGVELTASAEITHLQMTSGSDGLAITPGNMVSAEIGLRKSGLAFAGRDSLGLSFVLPPRAISGQIRVNYMTPTPDGLGRQAARLMMPLSRLGAEPPRVEAAYRLDIAPRWSVSLSGGANLANTGYVGAGELLAGMKLSF
jgi:hypothetical protein